MFELDFLTLCHQLPLPIVDLYKNIIDRMVPRIPLRWLVCRVPTPLALINIGHRFDVVRPYSVG